MARRTVSHGHKTSSLSPARLCRGSGGWHGNNRFIYLF